jgi:hypothetical protein
MTSLWAAAFAGLLAVRGVGDEQPGQALPFWLDACAGGSARACAYANAMLGFYCDDGSGWACNEWGLRLADGGGAPAAFRRSCARGFAPGCRNAEGFASGGGGGERSPPTVSDLPIVLRGTKPPLRERRPEALLARACEQGWDELCRG